MARYVNYFSDVFIWYEDDTFGNIGILTKEGFPKFNSIYENTAPVDIIFDVKSLKSQNAVEFQFDDSVYRNGTKFYIYRGISFQWLKIAVCAELAGKRHVFKLDDPQYVYPFFK